LVRRIFSDDKDEVMPPEEEHKALTPSQKETLKRWIAQGAEYQQHWAVHHAATAGGADDCGFRIADCGLGKARRGAWRGTAQTKGRD
jgi:hypothetical protein